MRMGSGSPSPIQQGWTTFDFWGSKGLNLLSASQECLTVFLMWTLPERVIGDVSSESHEPSVIGVWLRARSLHLFMTEY